VKYSLDVYIITNNNGLRNAVKNVLPSINHPGVWSDEYIWMDSINEDGDKFFFAMIRFDVKSERDGFTNSVKGLAGIIHQCLTGSFVREHKSYHDEEESKRCEIETILEP
jgi:hypothetical protein